MASRVPKKRRALKGSQLISKQRTVKRLTAFSRSNRALRKKDVERKPLEQTLLEAHTAIELIPEGISKLDDTGHYLFVNAHYAALLGYRPDELIGQSWEIAVHPDDHSSVRAYFARMRATGKAEAEVRGVRKDGSLIYKHVVLVRLNGSTGKMPGHFCFMRDVTERKRDEAFLSAEKQALELVAKGAKLEEVLTFICRTIEAHTAPMLTSIMLLTEDGKHLRCVAAPSLSGDYNRAVDGIPISPTVGSCGSAAYYRKPSIVVDIETDPLWKDYATVAMGYGLRACWSQPIMGPTGDLLGTFAAYYKEPRTPSATDLAVVERASHIAALAIQHDKMSQSWRESEARFHAFMAHSPAVSFIKDSAGRHLYINPTFERVFGVSLSEIRGKTLDGRLPDDVVAQLRVNDEKVLTSGEPLEVEETVPTPDGKSQQWLVLKFPLTSSSGERLLGGVAIDITERKRVEQALMVSEERYARATAVGRVGVWELDVQAGTYYGDRNLKMMFGYQVDELSADPYTWLHLVHPDDQSIAMAHWQQIMRRQADDYNYEVRMIRKDGTVIWTDVRGQAVRDDDGQVTHLIGATVDVTERKRMEAALRESEERYRSVVSAMAEGIVIQDQEGRIRSCNATACRILGLTEDQVLGRTSLDPQWHAIREDGSPFPGEIHPAMHTLRTGRACENVIMGVHRPDGSIVWISINTQPITSGADEPLLGVVASFRDITMQKQVEAALRQAHEELEQRVGERTAQLAQANRSLQDEVTERKRAEKALQLTQFTVDQAAQGIFWVGPKAEILYANDAACEVLGHSRAELLGMTVHDIDPNFPPEAWPTHWEELKRRGSFTFESTQHTKSGAVRHTEVTVNHLEYDGHEYNCAIVRDITERKLSEAALLESEERFSKAFNESPIGMAIVAPDGRWLQVNHALCEIVGYSKAELETMTFQAITHPDDLESDLHHVRQVLSGALRTYQLEKRYIHKDGSVIWIVLNVSLVRNADGTPKHFISQIQDITKRKQAEDTVRDSELRYKLLTEATFDGIAVHDQGILLEVNVGLERMFGYESGELVGRSMWDLIAEESRDLVLANMRNGVTGPYEAVGRRKDGTTFPGEVVVRPYRYRGKEVRLVAGRDITERKNLETERLRHTEELERQVAERTAEIAKLESQRAHAEKLAAMGRLAAGVAHEINNPIAGIKNAFTLVKQTIDPAHPHAEFTGMIDREIARVASIVQNMYQLYRPESGKGEAVELQVMLNDIVALFSKRLQQRRLVLAINADPCIDWLSVPRGDLLQVLLNLLNNAIDCSNEGGTITLTLRVEPDAIRIAVSDQGPGVSPENLPHIFDPFFTTKTQGNQKGMGLGLSISQSLVMAMGGRIEVQTQLNAGSTFSVLLPRRTAVTCTQDRLETNKEVATYDC